ncbi:hypothetical protein niasHT_037739 [Heterodera trifolii]|uniref:RING-type E3 ubiquitin transferase n=1 Tax=Heterodera trifolii TaxID=157864 RepID=A0ABD2J7P6_9BILA
MPSSPAQQQQKSSVGRPLCRYFASNICTKGDACAFSHEHNARPEMTCRYYLAGNCTYGNNCRYDHIRPQRNEAPLGGGGAKVTMNSAARPFVPAQQQTPKIADKKLGFPLEPPATNPWNINPLGNFHQNMAQELELIGQPNGPGNSSAATSAVNLCDIPLCPYFEVGLCTAGDFCPFLHGLACDMCGLNVLHPHNQTHRLDHHRECLAEHEKQMEEAFAKARSEEKQCGICMEQIVEKGLRFGILQNCTHCFCLDCIRKWRRQTDEEIKTKTVRSCPECRVHSDYVIPSKVWIDLNSDKDKLVSVFKGNTKKIACKYVVNGDVDKCPFGNKCFYKHQLPDGSIVEGKSPTQLRKNRRNDAIVFSLYDFLPSDSDWEDDFFNDNSDLFD